MSTKSYFWQPLILGPLMYQVRLVDLTRMRRASSDHLSAGQNSSLCPASRTLLNIASTFLLIGKTLKMEDWVVLSTLVLMFTYWPRLAVVLVVWLAFWWVHLFAERFKNVLIVIWLATNSEECSKLTRREAPLTIWNSESSFESASFFCQPHTFHGVYASPTAFVGFNDLYACFNECFIAKFCFLV